MLKLSASVLILLPLSMTTVFACTCEPRTWIEIFCNDPFAGMFYVKDNGTVTGDLRVYEVDFLIQFRPFDIPKDPDFDKIYTPRVSSACGIRLSMNKYYVITGYFITESGKCPRMSTSLCNIQKQLKDPTKFIPPICPPSY